MRPRIFPPLFGLFLCLLAVGVSAQQQSRDAEKERAILEKLQAASPSSVEPFKRATDALDAGDYAEAARLYEEVASKAPDFTPALRRLGFAWTRVGRSEEGLALLERAAQLENSPENMFSLAEALAYPAPDRRGTPEQSARALSLAKEADLKSRSSDASYPALVAQLALDLEREPEFRAALWTLRQRFPDDLTTHYFSAIAAAFDEDWVAAESEIRKAEARGLPHEVAQQFLDSGVGTRAKVWRYLYYVLYAAAAWAAGLVLLFVLGKIFSNLTMRAVESSDPEELTGARHEALRKYYRALINFAGFYYYVSLPVVLCLVVLAAAAVLYAFMALGRIPIKLVLVLGIGALITVYQMIRSFFVKHEQEDPGRALSEQEAPGLWALVREVAAGVGTRPADEIRITPGTDLAVYERGSARDRRQDRAARVLILGVGVLNGFSRNSFRAVLAHEYGHFSHRDTAGGDVALRVNSDMINFAMAMARGGQAVWYNLAFQFLRAYHFIFRRISHGATRLQEILADRVAVHNYGALAFEDGLRHVVYRSIEFDHTVSHEIDEAQRARRAVGNIYELPGAKGGRAEGDVEAAFRESIERPTTEDDTHPSPAERFRLAARVRAKESPAADGEVWELFADREGLTREMSQLVAEHLRAAEVVTA